MVQGILWICLMQNPQVHQMEQYTMAIDAQARAFEARKKSMATQERKQFEEKFNKLLDAIQQFSDQYNKSKGAVWPMKQAEQVKTAFQELERTSSWPKEKAVVRPEPVRSEGGQ